MIVYQKFGIKSQEQHFSEPTLDNKLKYANPWLIPDRGKEALPEQLGLVGVLPDEHVDTQGYVWKKINVNAISDNANYYQLNGIRFDTNKLEFQDNFGYWINGRFVNVSMTRGHLKPNTNVDYMNNLPLGGNFVGQ